MYMDMYRVFMFYLRRASSARNCLARPADRRRLCFSSPPMGSLIPATDSRVLILGRYCTSGSIVRFDWPATTIELRLRRSRRVWLRMNGNKNYFSISCNGCTPQILTALSRKVIDYSLPLGQSKSEDDILYIRIAKRTEAAALTASLVPPVAWSASRASSSRMMASSWNHSCRGAVCWNTTETLTLAALATRASVRAPNRSSRSFAARHALMSRMRRAPSQLSSVPPSMPTLTTSRGQASAHVGTRPCAVGRPWMPNGTASSPLTRLPAAFYLASQPHPPSRPPSRPQMPIINSPPAATGRRRHLLGRQRLLHDGTESARRPPLLFAAHRGKIYRGIRELAEGDPRRTTIADPHPAPGMRCGQRLMPRVCSSTGTLLKGDGPPASRGGRVRG